MSVSLIVGPPNSGRAGEVIARLRAAADREPVLVVPTSRDTARFERDLCGPEAAMLGVSITTFGWLFGDLAERLGLSSGAPLSDPERLALIRIAIAATPLQALRRSASQPGFAPALDALLAELAGALIAPQTLRLEAESLEDGLLEQELADLAARYGELRSRTGRSDAASLAASVLAGLDSHPDPLDGRPLFVYGFEDLTVAQRELLARLAAHGEVTIAVNYEDRLALAARAGMLAELHEELHVDDETVLEYDGSYSPSHTLVHLDRNLFSAGAPRADADAGLVLMESAGARGEAEAIALEAARLIAGGVQPDEILIVLRRPGGLGPLLAAVCHEHGVPAALEADVPLRETGVGRSLLALCRAAAGDDPADLLAHLRTDPAVPAGRVDWVERRVRRGEALSVDQAVASWSSPPYHLARIRDAAGPGQRLAALARAARAIAEYVHREQAPLAERSSASGSTPVVPLELRAGAAAAELLAELAAVGRLPGCDPPDLADAVAAIEGAGVPAWRGPAEGRVRILGATRVRGARARFLFCASLNDGEFPAGPGRDPLLGEERRAALGIPALRRRDPADEERFLFHACVSRPREHLYLSWQASDEGGTARARSPFVDEVLDLLGEAPAPRRRGLERVVPALSEAYTARARARALASARAETEARPGPLRSPTVVGELESRTAQSAGSLEKWLTCSYKWFVDHELKPVRLEPESDPLWLGGVIHAALERLYREAPGDDSIPRPGDLGRWQARFGELLDEEAGGAPRAAERRAGLARARVQVEGFLEDEANAETDLRPHPDFLEWSFGIRDGDAGELDLGEFRLHGIVDRVDVSPDGSGAVVRDYKSGARVPGCGAFGDQGTLQIPLYMRAVKDLGGLEPIAGLYQPLGAYKDRRARGMVLSEDERLRGISLVRTDACDAEAFEDRLQDAVTRATAAAARMHLGDIRRDPLGGRCPEYCEFQAICRLERAVGVEESEDEE